MKSIFTLLVAAALGITAGSAQSLIVPGSYPSLTPVATFTGPLANSGRTYQLLINENQLTSLVGTSITGLTFRLAATASASWPAADVTYTNYDIKIGPGVAPALRDIANFANNASGPLTTVRSGSLVIPAGSYPASTAPDPFGPYITFSTAYAYTGGHLLVEIRHDASNGTSTSNFAYGSAAAGYGTDFSGCWTGSYTGTGGNSGNFAVPRFSTLAVVPVTLTRFGATLQDKDVLIAWNTAGEINSRNFVVERSSNGRDFLPVGTITAAGNISTEQQYSFVDRNIDAEAATTYYYRLKTVDIDGRSAYSAVAVVHVNSKLMVASIFPNPLNNTGALNILAVEKQQINFRIVNSNGQVIKQGIYNVVKGNNRFELDIQEMSPGSYFLLLDGSNTATRVPFVKQ